MKPTAVLDTEVYPNYFLLRMRNVDTRGDFSLEMTPDQPLDKARARAVLQKYRLITFNGYNFDIPLVCAAIGGFTNAELSAMAGRIIHTRLRGWQCGREFGIDIPWNRFDHIDLIETVPGVQISLKLYGGRLHSKHLAELPYPPGTMLTPEQQRNVFEYCGNDLDLTIDLWKKARDPKDDIIATREVLGAEFGLDLRSKSDAQCAEAMIKTRVTKLLKTDKLYPQDIPYDTRYRYRAPAFLDFQTAELRGVFEQIQESDFIVEPSGKVAMPKALEDRKISIGTSLYRMGIGGLHSSEKCQGIRASDKLLLRDFDVISFYPQLILQCGLFPANMGRAFQQVYSDFYQRRVAAKKKGDKSTAQTLKIALNGTFGKLGSPYSILYSPDLLMQVTVTGQLVLLMMIEQMELRGIPVVSANTDGIVMACPAAREAAMLEVVRWWEQRTGFETEETQYAGLFSRDVNNYIAIKTNGEVKTKGVLADPGVMKNPANTIVNRAVADYLSKNVPVLDTIYGSRDIREFLRVQRVNGGATHKGQFLGKVVRWYRSDTSPDTILRADNGYQVPNSEYAGPCQTLPDTMPADLDRWYYAQEAGDLLEEIGAL